MLHDLLEQQKSKTIAIKIIKQQFPPKKLLLELEHEQQLEFIKYTSFKRQIILY